MNKVKFYRCYWDFRAFFYPLLAKFPLISLISLCERKTINKLWDLAGLQYQEGILLEIGCGIRPCSLGGEKWLRVGIDISYNMIALAKRKEKEWNFLIADTCMLPFKTNAFSAIVAVGLTESINDIDKWLQEIIGVLKSGGKIIFTFAPNIFTNWMRYIWNPVLNLRSEPFWLEICKNYGLRLIAKDKTLFQAQFLLVKEST